MTVAQIKAQRQDQLKKLKKSLRTFDSAEESLERLIKRYTNKRKMIEVDDIDPLYTAFRKMNDLFSDVERELTNLSNLVHNAI